MTHMKPKSGRLKVAELPRKDALRSREVDRNRKPWGRAAAEASNHAKARAPNRPETPRNRKLDRKAADSAKGQGRVKREINRPNARKRKSGHESAL